jgi:alcohol dehydrogenase class IV
MTFEFATAQRILFGDGTLQQAGKLVAELGTRALVVTFNSSDRAQPFLDLLRAAGVDHVRFVMPGEPKVDQVLAGVDRARAERCDVVVGFGGGSSMDTAKAIAALLTNPGDIYDYLEVIGKGQPLRNAAAPCVAIPTTAGTGAEVTRNAVIASPAHAVKVSLRNPSMLPRLALVDPELTHGLPPEITASTGLDALTQLIEPLTSSRANPLTDGIARAGLRRAVRSLRRVYEDGSDAAARHDMAFASLCGGLALANAGLGAVHGFAGALGGMHEAPHGAICAALLPAVVETNVRALRAREPQHPALVRYQEIAAMATGDPQADPTALVAWLRDLVAALRVPGLATFGLTPAEVPELVAKSRVASSMKGNPLPLTDDELQAIVFQSM